MAKDGERLLGVYVDNKWGQTGSNSSMYKWFDLLCGVAQARLAYSVDPPSLSRMEAVFDGRLDSGELGDNPIDSMQRAFDLLTRPPLHMRLLVDTEAKIRHCQAFDPRLHDPSTLLQWLRVAYWVADHRVTHGRYVMSSIYRTEPVGGSPALLVRAGRRRRSSSCSWTRRCSPPGRSSSSSVPAGSASDFRTA